MSAKIYRPAKTAMQSGKAKTHRWLLEFDQKQPRWIEPMMGYTSSSDMKQQIQLKFDSKEEAVGYAERHGIAYRIVEGHDPKRARIAYADNFRYGRRQPWTH